MSTHSSAEILRAFSQGEIGWREACRKLDLETFDELQLLMRENGVALYQPSSRETENKLDALEKLLHGE